MYIETRVSWPKQFILNATLQSEASGIEQPYDHGTNLLLRASYTSHDAIAELYQSPRHLCSLPLARRIFIKWSLIILGFTAAPTDMSQEKKKY